MADESNRSRKGKVLPAGYLMAGRYEILRALGYGGMGVVYLAADRMLNGERLAIKVLHSDYFDDENLKQRFLREVQLMRRINHRNVVRTYDLGQDGTFVYFTMEYVPGRPLDKIIAEVGSGFWRKAPFIALQMAEGLEAIHQAGVLHRDMKPANIILLDDGTLRITDFGVARPELSNLTSHDEIVGSVCYLAPEVWRGEPPTASVDLYSLGVVLYELTTGNVPFDGGTPAELMRLHLDREPVPPKDLNPELPSWLSRLVLMLLEKSTAKRPKTAREIIDYIKLRTSETENGEGALQTEDFFQDLEQKTRHLTPVEKRSTPGHPPETGKKRPTAQTRTVAVRLPARTKLFHRKAQKTGSGGPLLRFADALAVLILIPLLAAAIAPHLSGFFAPGIPRMLFFSFLTLFSLGAPLAGACIAASNLRTAPLGLGLGFVFFLLSAIMLLLLQYPGLKAAAVSQTLEGLLPLIGNQLSLAALFAPHSLRITFIELDSGFIFYPEAAVAVLRSKAALCLPFYAALLGFLLRRASPGRGGLRWLAAPLFLIIAAVAESFFVSASAAPPGQYAAAFYTHLPAGAVIAGMVNWTLLYLGLSFSAPRQSS